MMTGASKGGEALAAMLAAGQSISIVNIGGDMDSAEIDTAAA